MADFMRGNIIMSSSRVVLIALKHDDIRQQHRPDV